MMPKQLKNLDLYTKFEVGQYVKLPHCVWTKCTNKMIGLPLVRHEIVAVGPTMIEHGKNRLCRYAITLGQGTSSLFVGKVIWEEWMLEKAEIVPAPPPQVETCSITEDETSLPPHE